MPTKSLILQVAPYFNMFITRNDFVGSKMRFLGKEGLEVEGNRMDGLEGSSMFEGFKKKNYRLSAIALMAVLSACGGSGGKAPVNDGVDNTESPDGDGNGGGTTETLYNFNSNSEKTCGEGSSPEELKQTCAELQAMYGNLTYKTALGFKIPGELTFFVGDNSKVHVHIVFYYEGKPYNAYNDLTVTRSDGGLEIKQLVEGESAINPLTYYFDSTQDVLLERLHGAANKTLMAAIGFRQAIRGNLAGAVEVSDVYGEDGERCVSYDISSDQNGVSGSGEICEDEYTVNLMVGDAVYSVLGSGDSRHVSTETTGARGVIPLDSASTEAGAPLRYLFDNNSQGGLYSSANLDFSRNPDGQILFKMAASDASYVEGSYGEALVNGGNKLVSSSYDDLGINAGTESDLVKLYRPYLSELNNAPGALRYDLQGAGSGFGTVNYGSAQGVRILTEQALESDYRKRVESDLEQVSE